MNRNTCPICNKTGIPDFLCEDVVCPCCNSNLSIYRKLYQSQPKGRSSKGLWYVISILAIAMISISWGYNTHTTIMEQNKIIQSKLAQRDSVIIQLSDTISKLLYQGEVSTIAHSDQKIWYVVKRGDSFCRISKTIYGDESQYKIILKLNNLTSGTIVHPGDSIRVK